jgi:hypothetical protein
MEHHLPGIVVIDRRRWSTRNLTPLADCCNYKLLNPATPEESKQQLLYLAAMKILHTLVSSFFWSVPPEEEFERGPRLRSRRIRPWP